jgi:RNA polymerase sigma-70 factor (ECF subfamily)
MQDMPDTQKLQLHCDVIPIATHDATLYDQYGKVIFAYVRLHTPTREDAEDLTLDVFMAALERDNLSAFPEAERLAWLRHVARNRLIDTYRRTARHPIIVLDEVIESMLEENEHDTPEHLILQRELYEQLHHAIAKLPVLQQQILRLRYGDGLRFAEIAILLNKREDGVRKLLSRTIATLRTIFARIEQQGRQTW